MIIIKNKTCIVKTSDDPKIPPDILGILNDDDGKELFEGVDKHATPAERIYTNTDLERDMDRQNPLSLVSQRDSDANKNLIKVERKHGLILQK